MTGPPTPRRHDNAFARQRDARIAWLLDMHPMTAEMLVRVGLFPTKNKALRRLKRLVGRNRIRLVGTVCRKTGRPEHVYCRYRPKTDQLLHEIELTELCLRLHAGTIFRGPHVSDDCLRPDAEVWINGQRYHLELDRGTMSYTQIQRKRFRKYEGFQGLALWVCSSEIRLEGLRQRAENIRHNALFTTLERALAGPHEAIWVDYQGERAALPREGE